MRQAGWWILNASAVACGYLWVSHLLPGWVLLGVVLVCKGSLLAAAIVGRDSSQSPTQQIATRPGTRAGDFWSPGGPD